MFIIEYWYYALNFDAFGTFSPLRIRSAPTFLPLLGQPLFCPKRLCTSPQELLKMSNADKRTRRGKLVFLRLLLYMDLVSDMIGSVFMGSD